MSIDEQIKLIRRVIYRDAIDLEHGDLTADAYRAEEALDSLQQEVERLFLESQRWHGEADLAKAEVEKLANQLQDRMIALEDMVAERDRLREENARNIEDRISARNERDERQQLQSLREALDRIKVGAVDRIRAASGNLSASLMQGIAAVALASLPKEPRELEKQREDWDNEWP